MKKFLMIAASTALILSACGSKDKVDTKVEDAKVEVTKTVTETADKMEAQAKDAYGSDTKDAAHEETYGSGTEGAASALMSTEDRALMVKSCVDDGSSEANCGCAIDAMDGTLTKGTVDLLISGTKMEMAGDAAGAMKVLENMSVEQQTELMSYLPKVGECDPVMLQKMMGG